jgi:protoporphyrinogen IX oxidase
MDWYLYARAFHIVAVISWMVGMFYLPRLFAYHCRAKPGSEMSEMFKVMERRLMRIIVNPAMIVTWLLGLYLVYYLYWNNYSAFAAAHWLHVKLTLVTILSGFHGMLSIWRRDFEADRNTHTERFYRIVNEIPTLLMIGIVIMVIVRPF